MNSKTFGKDQVVTIINSVIQRIEKHDAPLPDAIYHELLALRGIIDTLRHEISATRPSEGLDHFPQAHDELDAVVLATEAATNNIMDACEGIQGEIASLPDAQRQAVEQQIMRIFEACSFQDITGQRIGKVTKSLKEIEAKLSAVINTISAKMPLQEDAHAASAPVVVDARPDADLCNGPQLQGHGISQADIDKLLEDF